MKIEKKEKPTRSVVEILSFLMEGLNYDKPMRKLGKLRRKGCWTRSLARRRVRNRMARESRRINFARARR
jgi:hypothetical protein